MKKTGFLTFLTGFVTLGSSAFGATYPAARVQTSPQGQVVYLPAANNGGVVVANSKSAAAPTRVTGSLPRVGSTATNAGRQYYQPADYERLADSGLYIGLSAGYTVSMFGKVSADYSGETGAFLAPGAFRETEFKRDTVIPLQVSLGAAINSDLRIDFSYLRYSGISYPSSVPTADGDGGFVDSKVSGGAITANATMLNLYYNIDSLTGYIAGGKLRPYIGVGVGLSLNTIADYVVLDDTYYPVISWEDLEVYGIPGDTSGYSDIYGYHNGGTTEQFAFGAELGVTAALSGGLSLDLFARYVNLGKVKTSGSIVVSQTEWLTTGDGIYPYEYESPYDVVTHYTDWQESGRLSMIDVGARLRLQF